MSFSNQVLHFYFDHIFIIFRKEKKKNWEMQNKSRNYSCWRNKRLLVRIETWQATKRTSCEVPLKKRSETTKVALKKTCTQPYLLPPNETLHVGRGMASTSKHTNSSNQALQFHHPTHAQHWNDPNPMAPPATGGASWSCGQPMPAVYLFSLPKSISFV